MKPVGAKRVAWLDRAVRGFTLIEILVALAIAAVALAAGMRALAQAADGAGTLKARTLALWVAQDRLAALQLTPELLARPNDEGTAAQAGMAFVWNVSVRGTPNPSFRRVDIAVAEPQSPTYALARLTGYVAVPLP
jgi:general secretion pathway protein I